MTPFRGFEAVHLVAEVDLEAAARKLLPQFSQSPYFANPAAPS
jgi:hypothetical protein